MKKKFLQCIKLALPILAMLISSCSNPAPTPDPEPSGPDIFDPIDLGPGEDFEVSKEELQYHSNQDYDVDKDYRVKVKINDMSNDMSYNDIKYQLLHQNTSNNELVSINDNNGRHFQTSVTSKLDEEGKEYFEIYPFGDTYQEGSIMTATLRHDALTFKDRDPEFDKLYFNIPREETNYYSISNGVPFYDINKVTYFPIADGEVPSFTDPTSKEAADYFMNATFHFGFKEEIKLDSEQTFGISIIKNGQADVSNANTFYGKFISCQKEEDHYRVTFKNADITEIFKDDETGDIAFDVHQEVDNATLKNVKNKFNKEAFKEELYANPSFLRLCQAIANVSDNGLPELLSLFSISMNFSFKDNTLYIQLGVSGLIPFGQDKEQALSISMTFQWSICFGAKGDIKVKKFLGIPYWITAYGEVTKTTDFAFTLKINWMINFSPAENDKAVMQRVREAYSSLENDSSYFTPRWEKDGVMTGNHISQPIAALEIPFLYVFSFKLQLSLELTIDLNVMFEYGFRSHTVEKVLSFTTDNGVENTSNTTEQSGSTHTIALGGKIYIGAGLKLSMSVGFAGLTSLLSIGASVEGGLYFEIFAMGGASFGKDQSPQGYGAIGLEMGVYAKLSANFDFLFVFHFSYDFLNVKYAFLNMYSPVSVLDLLAQDVTLTTRVTSVDNTKLLMVKQFNADTFQVGVASYRTDSQVSILSGDKITPLTLTCDSSYISFDTQKNWIIVSDDAPAYFEANITVKMDGRLDGWLMTGTVRSKTVKVTFTSETAHTLSLGKNPDDDHKILAETGKEVVLPKPTVNSKLNEEVIFSKPSYTSKGGETFTFEYNDYVYDFLSYTDGTNDYKPGDAYTMPDQDTNITVNLYKIVYYTVNYYDGNNKLIHSYQVREHTAAPLPEEKERNMDGYYFVGWDRDTSHVDEDLNVYGVYVKGSTQA